MLGHSRGKTVPSVVVMDGFVGGGVMAAATVTMNNGVLMMGRKCSLRVLA